MSATTRRIEILASPLLWVGLGTGLFSIETALFAFHGQEAPAGAVVLYAFMFMYGLAAWVQIDRRKRKIGLPREFDVLVFFGWPLVIPYYVYRTRGTRGIALVIWIYVLSIIPGLVHVLVYPYND